MLSVLFAAISFTKWNETAPAISICHFHFIARKGGGGVGGKRLRLSEVIVFQYLYRRLVYWGSVSEKNAIFQIKQIKLGNTLYLHVGKLVYTKIICN